MKEHDISAGDSPARHYLTEGQVLEEPGLDRTELYLVATAVP